MSELIKTLKQQATTLHQGVTYGGGLNMLDQVTRCAEIATETGDDKLVMLALMHKAQEEKRIVKGVRPLTDDELANLLGRDNNVVLRTLKLLKTEDAKEKELEQKHGKDNKDAIWKGLSEWSVGLAQNDPEAGTLAQKMLLVEKITNFETSRDNPNPSWSAEKHAAYYNTRMLMVEALAEISPELHSKAVVTAIEGLVKLQKTEATKSLDIEWGLKALRIGAECHKISLPTNLR